MNVWASLAAPFSLFSRLIFLMAVLWVPCGSVLAQAGNTNYTADLPSVERVKAEIKGSDPTDTLARQVAVFTYLPVYIERIKYNRTVRGPYTPDEARLIGAYNLAAYQISQDYAKTHTPEEAKAFERLHGQYEMNSDFYKDWSKRLIGPQSAAAYHGAERELAATGQKHYEQEMQQYKSDRAAQQAADKQIFGNKSGLSDDPTAVATRRCLELGGSSLGCVGKGMGAGFMDMIGFNTEEITGPGRAGVVLAGLYRNPATLASLSFGAGEVSIQDCGKLVADGHGYTIDKRPGSLRVIVENEPKPFTLTMRPDGGLIGPGPIDVKGRIIIGYHTVTETLYVNGQPAVGGSCGGVCSTSTQVPDYAPKIERCTIGSLGPPPRPKPAAAQPAGGDSGMLGLITGLADTFAPGSNEPGLRMTGKYGSGTLLLDFSPGGLVLDCGQAHVRQPYTVENAPEQLLIHVENSGGRFTLAVMPDNSLRGSGSTTVNGRLVTGMRGDDVAFAPHSETCNVATFTPKSGSMPTMVASGGSAAPSAAMPPPAAPVEQASAGRAPVAYGPAPATPVAPAAAVAPAVTGAAASTPSASPSSGKAAMRVLITSGFPANANPVAGQSVYVMRERMDDVLRKLGIPVPPNSTPGKAMQTLATACRTMNCGPVMSGLSHYYVTAAKLDSAGKATLSAQAATGSYFFFALVRTPEGSMVWDIPSTLSAGDNNVTLTAANAEVIH
jgi:hypothetical protein